MRLCVVDLVIISLNFLLTVMPEGREPLRKDVEALIVNLDETNRKLE